MARDSNQSGLPPDIRVLIRNDAGHYLAGEPRQWFFTPDRALAAIFSYDADHVREQLEAIQQRYGIVLVADPVPPDEIYELCDRCRELFMPVMIFFDGKRFLCPDCRQLASPRPQRGFKA